MAGPTLGSGRIVRAERNRRNVEERIGDCRTVSDQGEQGARGDGREMDALVDLVRGRTFALLTGAGCSTDSGIPDYRGPGRRGRVRQPIQYGDFIRDAATRQRYWARAMVGWPRFREARPNRGHVAMAQMEALGVLTGLITQNVDRLHQAAGSRRVVELHGALARVRCQQCGAETTRDAEQERLVACNPGLSDWLAQRSFDAAPDGDAVVPPGLVETFVVVGCHTCGGMLKPDVVFFGETVPRPTVEDAMSVLESAQALLVVGSSLAVFSGYRFVRAAVRAGQPVAIVTLGATRGDTDAALKIDAPIGRVLPELLERLR